MLKFVCISVKDLTLLTIYVQTLSAIEHFSCWLHLFTLKHVDNRPQAGFFGIYGWLVKIYSCFLAKWEKRIMENLG